MVERLISGDVQEDDLHLDRSLRPRSLQEFVGQDRIKDQLSIAMTAARQRGEPLDHILFYGPPGLGKTTLANIVAAEMGVNVRITSGPAVERAGDLAAILTNLKSDDLLFIDEIHRLPRVVEEVLYPALEDFALDIVLGKGPAARSLRLTLPRFTLIGATTRYAMVSAPLRDRLGNVYRLDFYEDPPMEAIVRRSAKILRVDIDKIGAHEIARRARGTPRVANRLLKQVRDYTQVMTKGGITGPIALEALSRLNIDELGLDQTDHSVLKALIEKFAGGPVGLETLSASISEEADTIMDVYEPYLLKLGFIQRTPRGRMATELAYQHLGIAVSSGKKGTQSTLWEQGNL